MSGNLFELKLTDSPIPQAMDVYYDQVLALVQSEAAQKIALTNNIVDFPIRSNTRLFNNYVARSFADRAISQGSPVDTGEKFLGPANVNDSFSQQFGVLLNRAIAGIRLDLSQEDKNNLDESNRLVDGYENDLDKLIDQVLDEWEDYKNKYLQGKSEKEIELEQAAWLDTHRLRRRMEVVVSEIDRELATQELIIERAGNPEDSQIYRAYNALRNSKVAYPTVPQLEIEEGLNEVKMGNPLVVGLNPSWADVGAAIDAVVDWEEFLQDDGARGFTISRTDKSDESHEKEWSVSATFRYSFYFVSNINASEHERTKEALNDTLTITFNFQRISEIWIRRGNWYDSDIFNLPKIKKLLENDQKLATNLRYSVASLLIGRGFSLSLSFDHEEHYEYFKNQQLSGSAKILNIFPVGSGSVNETNTKQEDHDKSKTVTFADAKDLVRIIGFKVDEMHSLSTDQGALAAVGIFPSKASMQRYIVKHFNLPQDYFKD